jgi:hypothetical protein
MKTYLNVKRCGCCSLAPPAGEGSSEAAIVSSRNARQRGRASERLGERGFAALRLVLASSVLKLREMCVRVCRESVAPSGRAAAAAARRTVPHQRRIETRRRRALLFADPAHGPPAPSSNPQSTSPPRPVESTARRQPSRPAQEQHTRFRRGAADWPPLPARAPSPLPRAHMARNQA